VVSRGPRRDEIWLVQLDPTLGAGIRKIRPALVVSPNEMNQHLQTVIVAPMTTALRPYPTGVPLRFQGKSGQVVLDQIRVIDRDRLVRKLGSVAAETAEGISSVLLEMFTR
jgi:mRNA interferase MazF